MASITFNKTERKEEKGARSFYSNSTVQLFMIFLILGACASYALYFWYPGQLALKHEPRYMHKKSQIALKEPKKLQAATEETHLHDVKPRALLLMFDPTAMLKPLTDLANDGMRLFQNIGDPSKLAPNNQRVRSELPDAASGKDGVYFKTEYGNFDVLPGELHVGVMNDILSPDSIELSSEFFEFLFFQTVEKYLTQEQQAALDLLSPKGREDLLKHIEANITPTILELQQKNFPNITMAQQLVVEDIESTLQSNSAANWSFPFKEFVNATLEGGPFPTVVPFQQGPLPNFRREIWCNPAIHPCVSASALLLDVGYLMTRVYEESYLGKTQLRLANFLEHDVASRVLDPEIDDTLVFFLQQAMAIEMLESILFAIEPLTTYNTVNYPLWTLALNGSALVYETAGILARTDSRRQADQLIKDRIRSAIMCRLFNGRLPNCVPFNALEIIPTMGPISREIVFDPVSGFIQFVYIFGFSASCTFQNSCISGTSALQPENFDGLYVLFGLGTNNFPIYIALRVFFSISALNTLYLWQGVTSINPNNPAVGGWAFISPQQPENIFAASERSLPPFAYISGISPVNTCSLSPPQPMVADNTTWPICMDITNRWRLARLTDQTCNGVIFDGICTFPIVAQTFGTNPTVPGRFVEESEIELHDFYGEDVADESITGFSDNSADSNYGALPIKILAGKDLGGISIPPPYIFNL